MALVDTNYSSCVLCQAQSRAIIFRKPFALIIQCTCCGMVNAVSPNSGKFIVTDYDERYFYNDSGNLEYTEGYPDYFGDEWNERKLVNESFANILASRIETKANVLDVGCGGGQLLSSMEKLGHSVFGVDLSEFAVSQAKIRYGLQIFNGTIEEYISTAQEKVLYDLITAIDVIEHLADPVRDLALLRTLLKDSGYIFLSTPMYGGRMSKNQGAEYFQFKRDHLHYFSKTTLSLLLRICGFQHIEFFTLSELRRISSRYVHREFLKKYTDHREQLFVFAQKQ